jgi:hypothetical protein
MLGAKNQPGWQYLLHSIENCSARNATNVEISPGEVSKTLSKKQQNKKAGA